jgi:hypothetical protein
MSSAIEIDIIYLLYTSLSLFFYLFIYKQTRVHGLRFTYVISHFKEEKYYIKFKKI